MPENLPVPFFDAMNWAKTGEQIPGPGEIHIWKARLDNWGEKYADFRAYLPDLEIKRAERLKIESLRYRFTAGHAITRLILGQYLNLAPGEVEISFGPGGKPLLAGQSNQLINSMFFNISHSGDMLLLSISRHFELGIDLETIQLEFEHDIVARHFFSVKERIWLENQQPDQKAAAFFRMWTCKEAILKAEGSGIRRSLEEVQINFGPGPGEAHAALVGGINPGRVWSLRLFEPAPGYTAALAFENNASAAGYPVLSFHQWID